MAICPFCSQKTRQVGELCSCGAGYTVHDDHGEDSLGFLGTLIANKFIPIDVLSESAFTVYYEAFQPAVDRTISMIIIKSNFFKDKDKHDYITSILDKCSGIKQQNTPILLEVIDLPDKKCFGVTYEAIKGEPILDYLLTRQQFEETFPGYEGDIHGVERRCENGRTVFTTLCLK